MNNRVSESFFICLFKSSFPLKRVMLATTIRKQFVSIAHQAMMIGRPAVGNRAMDWISSKPLNCGFATRQQRETNKPTDKQSTTRQSRPSPLRYQPDALSTEDACKLLRSRGLTYAEVRMLISSHY